MRRRTDMPRWIPRNKGDEIMDWWRDYIVIVDSLPLPLDEPEITQRLHEAKAHLTEDAIKQLKERQEEVELEEKGEQ